MSKNKINSTELWIANIDLKVAFDSVNWKALWILLLSPGFLLDIRKHIALVCNCMASLDHNIWHSSISLPTNLRLKYSSFLSFSIEPKHGHPVDSW